MSTYRIGTITGTQAGLSVTAIVQDVEWATSATERNRQTVAGDIYASSMVNARAEVKIRAVVPRQYSGVPSAGGLITVKGCSITGGVVSLDLADENTSETFRISGSRIVASNKFAVTLEITGYEYYATPESVSFDWILTDEQAADEYGSDVSFANPDPDKYILSMSIVTLRRTTTTKTWRKAILATDPSPGQANPGNLSPTGWTAANGRIGRWVCIDSGCSRPYFLNGQIFKEAFVTWQQVSAWEIYNEGIEVSDSA